MKKLLTLLLTAAIVLSTAACANGTVGSSGNKDESQTSSTTSEGSTATAPSEENEEIELSYSEGFSIEILDDGIKKVTDGEKRELYLVPKSLGEIPKEYADKTVITTPVENAVFMSSTQVVMLKGAEDDEIWSKIGGVSSGSWSSIPKLQSAIDDGSVKAVGGDMGDPDYEAIQALEPDVVFVYTGSFPQTDIINKLDELGITYAVDNDYMETNYLARMEWMKFILTFYDLDEKADSIMNEATKQTNDMKEKVQTAEKKKVAMFYVYDGQAYFTSEATWIGSMLKDVNGENVFAGVDAYSLTLEEIYDKAQDADIIIYTGDETYADGLSAITEAFPQITECAAYKNGEVYQYTNLFWNGANDTDTIAADLAAVIYPELFDGRELSYFKPAK